MRERVFRGANTFPGNANTNVKQERKHEKVKKAIDRRSGNALPAFPAKAAVNLDQADFFGPIGPSHQSNTT